MARCSDREGGVLTRQDLAERWAGVRRPVGTALIALGVAAFAVVAFGHVGSTLIGSRLHEGQPYRWADEPLYIKSLSGRQQCSLDDRWGPPGQVTVGVHYGRGNGFAGSHESVKLGGAAIGPADRPGQITCTGEVRIGSGWIVHVYAVADGGLWVVIPAAAALVVGGASRKSARSRRSRRRRTA